MSTPSVIRTLALLQGVDDLVGLIGYLQQNHNAYHVPSMAQSNSHAVVIFNIDESGVIRLKKRFGVTSVEFFRNPLTEAAREVDADIDIKKCNQALANRMLQGCGGDEQLMRSRLNESISASAHRAWVCRGMLYGGNGFRL